MKKQKEVHAAGAEKMSEQELSRRLGHYQRAAAFWTFFSLVCVLAGTVVLLIPHNLVLSAVLYFAGIGCAIFFGGGAEKKKKALMKEQMGEFFREELENAFGSELCSEKMRIDQAGLKASRLLDYQWEECEIRNFHEGVCRGIHFSAANAVLNHVSEIRIGQEGQQTCRERVFEGLIIHCETRDTAPSAIHVNARIEDDRTTGFLTDDEAFNRRFLITAASEQDAFRLLTPAFIERLAELEKISGTKLDGLLWNGCLLSLALETNGVFAEVPGDVDVRDLAAVRRRYVMTLQAMERVMDLLKGAALFMGQK